MIKLILLARKETGNNLSRIPNTDACNESKDVIYTVCYRYKKYIKEKKAKNYG